MARKKRKLPVLPPHANPMLPIKKAPTVPVAPVSASSPVVKGATIAPQAATLPVAQPGPAAPEQNFTSIQPEVVVAPKGDPNDPAVLKKIADNRLLRIRQFTGKQKRLRDQITRARLSGNSQRVNQLSGILERQESEFKVEEDRLGQSHDAQALQQRLAAEGGLATASERTRREFAGIQSPLPPKNLSPLQRLASKFGFGPSQPDAGRPIDARERATQDRADDVQRALRSGRGLPATPVAPHIPEFQAKQFLAAEIADAKSDKDFQQKLTLQERGHNLKASLDKIRSNIEADEDAKKASAAVRRKHDELKQAVADIEADETLSPQQKAASIRVLDDRALGIAKEMAPFRDQVVAKQVAEEERPIGQVFIDPATGDEMMKTEQGNMSVDTKLKLDKIEVDKVDKQEKAEQARVKTDLERKKAVMDRAQTFMDVEEGMTPDKAIEKALEFEEAYNRVTSAGDRDLEPFDPEGSGFDESGFQASGGQRDSTGHASSRDPRTGMIFKGRGHETFGKTLAGERAAGNTVFRGEGGRIFSLPADQVPPGAEVIEGDEADVAPVATEPVGEMTIRSPIPAPDRGRPPVQGVSKALTGGSLPMGIMFNRKDMGQTAINAGFGDDHFSGLLGMYSDSVSRGWEPSNEQRAYASALSFAYTQQSDPESAIEEYETNSGKKAGPDLKQMIGLAHQEGKVAAASRQIIGSSL